MKKVIKNHLASMVVLLCVCTLLYTTSGCRHSEENVPPEVKSDTTYFYAEDEKVYVVKMHVKFYMEFYADDEQRITDECARRGILLYNVYSKSDLTRFVVEGTEGPGAHIFDNRMMGYLEGSYEQCTDVLSSALYWSPVYYLVDGESCELRMTTMFTVILKTSTTVQQIAELAEKNAVEMLGFDKYDDTPNWYHLACTHRSKGNSLEMANLFYESSDLFETAWPTMIGCGTINL